jgi:hypothetical protein
MQLVRNAKLKVVNREGAHFQDLLLPYDEKNSFHKE